MLLHCEAVLTDMLHTGRVSTTLFWQRNRDRVNLFLTYGRFNPTHFQPIFRNDGANKKVRKRSKSWNFKLYWIDYSHIRIRVTLLIIITPQKKKQTQLTNSRNRSIIDAFYLPRAQENLRVTCESLASNVRLFASNRKICESLASHLRAICE